MESYITSKRLLTTSEISETSHNAPHLQAVGEYWPRRLLHVPRMESLEQSVERGIVHYGDHAAPSYNILTYTWGRWEDITGEAIYVGGITWKTPRILISHFMPQQIHATLRRVARDCDFVWVDIACIDQDDTLVKNDEIGRQAAIFEKADMVYAWFTTLSTEHLQNIINSLHSNYVFCENYMEEATPGKELRAWLISTLDACSQLLRDPWFSSLWTLQEAYLRHDAVLLSQAAETIRYPGSQFRRHAILNDLIRCFHGIHNFTERIVAIEDLSDTDMYEKFEFLAKVVLESGLSTLHDDNPVSVYGVACFRRPTETLDRVEGIQQIFGLQIMNLGLASLEELQTRLAVELNLRSPLHAQLFVHMMPAPAGLSWRLSQNVRVPEAVRWAAGRYTTQLRGKLPAESLCQISQTGVPIVFHGCRCSFSLILPLWRKDSISFYGFNSSHLSENIPVQLTYSVFLDKSSLLPASICGPPLNFSSTSQRINLCEALHEYYGNGLQVALLGKLHLQTQGLDQGTSELWAGMLILINEQKWARIGICLWEVHRRPAESLWERCSLELA